MTDIILKKGREKSARQFHPWLFSGAIAEITGGVEPGQIVRVLDSNKEFIAYGYFNPAPQIRVRLLEWDEKKAIDDEWWHRKAADAVNARKILEQDVNTDSYRLIFGESDFLPGLIVDKYADYLVFQSLTAGIEAVKNIIIHALREIVNPTGIYERSDIDIRKLEGLKQFKGNIYGQEPHGRVTILENGLKFAVDIKNGQKTGFYLDQRGNRQMVSRYCSGLDVLDCFCYTGGFSTYALKCGAKSVTLADSSAEALAQASENIRLNDLDLGHVESVRADVFELLREFRDRGRMFDMIILDPPKFAASQVHLKKALAGYKDINMLAMSILRPGGILATFSCSGAVSAESLKMAIFWASLDVSRQVQYIQTLSQRLDHPILASFPESEYLKGFICRVC